MKTTVHLILALTAIAMLTGCSTPYMVDRRRGATDTSADDSFNLSEFQSKKFRVFLDTSSLMYKGPEDSLFTNHSCRGANGIDEGRCDIEKGKRDLIIQVLEALGFMRKEKGFFARLRLIDRKTEVYAKGTERVKVGGEEIRFDGLNDYVFDILCSNDPMGFIESLNSLLGSVDRDVKATFRAADALFIRRGFASWTPSRYSPLEPFSQPELDKVISKPILDKSGKVIGGESLTVNHEIVDPIEHKFFIRSGYRAQIIAILGNMGYQTVDTGVFKRDKETVTIKERIIAFNNADEAENLFLFPNEETLVFASMERHPKSNEK